MKKFSKILSVALLVALVLSLGASAFADDPAPTGKITVENATVGEKYTLYKVFDATVVEGRQAGAKGISYKSNWFTTSNEYFTVDEAGNISSAVSGTQLSAGQITWLKSQKEHFTKIGETITAESATVEWTGLAPGYYFIESTVGTAVTVTSITPDVTVIDKNQTTTYDKQESVDSTVVDEVETPVWLYVGAGKVEDPIPSANVGDKVDYKVTGTISHYVGEEKVVSMKFFDTMTDGLTLNKDVAITVGGANITSTATIDYDDTANTTTITFPTVDANGDFLYANNAEYVITYSATINENAIIDTDPEDNTVEIYFNEDNKIGEDTTKVTDYQITLTKQDATTKAKLAGAEFDLYDAATDGNQIPVVLVPNTAAENYGTAESTVNNVYRHAKAGENGVKMVVGTTGIIEIKGLKNGSYFFEETKAPDGYNKLTARTEAVTITNANAKITVDNNSGTQLPSTGGIGTTIFYVVGGILVVAAGVLLVTKKRMSE